MPFNHVKNSNKILSSLGIKKISGNTKISLLSNLRLETKIENPTRLIAIILATLLLSSFSLVSIELYANHSLDKVSSVDQAIQHKLNLANNVFSLLESADISQRDYILTGNINYLATYRNAIPKINTALRQINSNSTGYSVDSDIGKLIALTNDKEEEFKQTISAYQTSGVNAAIATFSQSEYSTSQINKVVNHIQLEEAQSLTKYQARRSLYETIINIASPILLALDTAIVILTLYLVRTGLRKENLLERQQTEFISIASHQLRTPATTIKQYIYLLNNGFYGHLNKKQINALNKIDSANHRSINIANNLLYVSQLESGKIKIERNSCNLVDLLNQALDNHDSDIKSNGLKIVRNVPSKPYVIKADERLLMIVFEILIDNACRYTPSGRHIYVDLKNKSDNFLLSFRDEGIGIEPKMQKQLFKKFSRLDNGILMNPDGSGIGLYLLKNIMQLYGFSYSLKSELNKGSTFSISLPK